MYKLRIPIAALAAILFLTPAAAFAKNYCVNGFPNPSWNLVGIGFKVPAKGTCKAWNGFNPANSDNAPTTGVGCTSSDGTNLSLMITTSDGPGAFIEMDSVSLSLPSASGEVAAQEIGGSEVLSFGPISGIHGQVCTTNNIPAAIARDSTAPVRNGNDSVVK